MKDQVVPEEIRAQKLLPFLKLALVAGALIVVGGLATLYIRHQKGTREARAFDLLFEADRVEADLIKASKDKSANPLDLLTKADAETQKKYEQKITEVISEYPQSAASLMAALRMARWDQFRKNYAAAISRYDYVMQHAADSDWVLYRAIAFEGRAIAQENMKSLPEAEKTYDDFVKMNGNPLKPLAYLGSARVKQQLGKTQEAKELYEKVLKEFPNSDYEKKARALVALLGAKNQ
jgi:tetratricopeptide (TPR) repeat protein